MTTRRQTQNGHSVIELALMAPWIFFLFMAVLDVGFYMYAAINTENAARNAVMYTASSRGSAADQATACTYALQELGAFPFPGARPTSCSAAPLVVTANQIASLDGEAAPVYASSVTVTVTTLPMIPIPGLIGQLVIQRTAQARVKDDL
jgi:TadE-like protein